MPSAQRQLEELRGSAVQSRAVRSRAPERSAEQPEAAGGTCGAGASAPKTAELPIARGRAGPGDGGPPVNPRTGSRGSAGFAKSVPSHYESGSGRRAHLGRSEPGRKEQSKARDLGKTRRETVR